MDLPVEYFQKGTSYITVDGFVEELHYNTLCCILKEIFIMELELKNETRIFERKATFLKQPTFFNLKEKQNYPRFTSPDNFQNRGKFHTLRVQISCSLLRSTLTLISLPCSGIISGPRVRGRRSVANYPNYPTLIRSQHTCLCCGQFWDTSYALPI